MTLQFFLLLWFISFGPVFALIDCTEVIDQDNIFTGRCNNKWFNLKPYIRPAVGFAWIQYKLQNDFSDYDDAQDKIDAEEIPAILGPNEMIYIVDHHHTLAALDYSNYHDVSVTINIICDKRSSNESIFWDDLEKQNLVYLVSHPLDEPNTLPEAITSNELPAQFSFTIEEKVFSDDPWRSMASFARKVTQAPAPTAECSDEDENECHRCMFRGCDNGYNTYGASVPFFEFRWSYFLNDATYFSTQYWSSSEDLNTFQALYEQLSVSNFEEVNLDNWINTASYVIPLCRSMNTATYQLPVQLYSSIELDDSTYLPGYVSNYLKLSPDPECDIPICT